MKCFYNILGKGLAKAVVGDMTVEEGMAKYKENAEMLNVQKVVDE